MLAHISKEEDRTQSSLRDTECDKRKHIHDDSNHSNTATSINVINASFAKCSHEVRFALEGAFSEAESFYTSVAAAFETRSPVGLPGLGTTWPCCLWTPHSLSRGPAGNHPVRAFVSEHGRFHLDGTWNPRTVLTCSMATV